MVKLLNKISFFYDYITDRYECFVVESADDLTSCFAIRKRVFENELKRGDKELAFSPAEKEAIDDDSIQIACRDKDTGKIIGTVRITPIAKLLNDRKYASEYRLDLFPHDLLENATVVSRLAVLAEHRKSPAALNLACHCYHYGLTNNIAISLLVCEPNFYSMYRRLGYKPLSKIHRSPFGGYRLPLYLVLHSYDRLRTIRSPFLKVAKKLACPADLAGLGWEEDFLSHSRPDDTGFELIKDSSFLTSESQLLEGLSEASCDSLFKGSVKIECQYGDVVLAQGAGGKNFGVVHKGALEVSTLSGQTIVLAEGDVFGEVAFLLHTSRSAALTAATDDTEVILFSLSAVKKISSLEDQSLLWKNMAKVLARRLIVKNDA